MDVDVKALGFNPSGDSMSRCSPRRGIGCPESAGAGCSLQHQGRQASQVDVSCGEWLGCGSEI